jgi:hypothetical protein
MQNPTTVAFTTALLRVSLGSMFVAHACRCRLAKPRCVERTR